jgi:hypothetical protein
VTTTCKTKGVHTMPADQQSWGHAQTDLLVAACLDGCQACQEALTSQACRNSCETFGQLFTTFLMENASLAARLGFPAPRTGSDLFPGRSLNLFQEPTRRLLAAVTYPPVPTVSVPAGAAVLALPDGTQAAHVLARMSRQDRRLALDDILDNIVGRISLGGVL